MNDFEKLVKQLVIEDIDLQLGPRRPAPPFAPGSRSRPPRPSRTWLLALSAAAVVLLLVGGVIGLQRIAKDSRPARPGLPGTAVPGPEVSGGSPTLSGNTGQYTRVNLGTATIALPVGWVAHDYARYVGSAPPTTGPAWCLTSPVLSDIPLHPGQCPLALLTIPNHWTGQAIDVDIPGGLKRNPNSCGLDSGVRSTTAKSGVRNFGGRAADFRHYEYKCSDGTLQLVDQYVVDTQPGFILFSDVSDSDVEVAMTTIVDHSTLPPQTSPLRYEDYGALRSITGQAGGVQINLERVEGPDHTLADPRVSPAYFIPNAVLNAAKSPPKVGDLLHIYTDGHTVQEIS